MKTLLRIAALLIAAVVGTWIVVQFKGQQPPPGLGITNDGLAECPDTPNCVCSDCDASGKMPPLKFSGEPAAAITALKAALKKKGIPVVEEKENYLHAV